jgi:hypothetical protein
MLFPMFFHSVFARASRFVMKQPVIMPQIGQIEALTNPMKILGL